MVSVLTDALSVHRKNSAEVDYLYRYYKGEQPILRRMKVCKVPPARKSAIAL